LVDRAQPPDDPGRAHRLPDQPALARAVRHPRRGRSATGLAGRGPPTVSAIEDDEYDGPAVVAAPALDATVRVRFAGRFEPVDGRYHWGGRIAPDDRLGELIRAGQRSVTVQIG